MEGKVFVGLLFHDRFQFVIGSIPDERRFNLGEDAQPVNSKAFKFIQGDVVVRRLVVAVSLRWHNLFRQNEAPFLQVQAVRIFEKFVFLYAPCASYVFGFLRRL